jgi:hypothetical protein
MATNIDVTLERTIEHLDALSVTHANDGKRAEEPAGRTEYRIDENTPACNPVFQSIVANGRDFHPKKSHRGYNRCGGRGNCCLVCCFDSGACGSFSLRLFWPSSWVSIAKELASNFVPDGSKHVNRNNSWNPNGKTLVPRGSDLATVLQLRDDLVW